MTHVAVPALYAVGFAVTTVGLHAMGALGALLALCRPSGSARLRIAGTLTAAIGALLLVSGQWRM
jgi:hydrogenase/urease accessory protein HupE